MQFLETMGKMLTKYSGFFVEGVENTLKLLDAYVSACAN